MTPIRPGVGTHSSMYACPKATNVLVTYVVLGNNQNYITTKHLRLYFNKFEYKFSVRVIGELADALDLALTRPLHPEPPEQLENGQLGAGFRLCRSLFNPLLN